MHRPVRRGARAVARVRSAPWRSAGPALALASLAALWIAVRAELLAVPAALALTTLLAAAWSLTGREPGAR